MTATIISTGPQYTFGALTNRLVGGLIAGNTQLERLKEAIATASSGYTGTPGTEFEIGQTAAGVLVGNNLFGVVADTENPGQKGTEYSYAVGRLHELWAAFWVEAEQYVEQLDNGTGSL